MDTFHPFAYSPSHYVLVDGVAVVASDVELGLLFVAKMGYARHVDAEGSITKQLLIPHTQGRSSTQPLL